MPFTHYSLLMKAAADVTFDPRDPSRLVNSAGCMERYREQEILLEFYAPLTVRIMRTLSKHLINF